MIKKIVLWISAVAVFAFIIGACFVDVSFDASAADICIYRFAACSMFIIIEIGILVELNLFHIKSKIPLIKEKNVGKHILFWLIVFVIAIVSFGTINAFTSKEFQLALSEQSNTQEQNENQQESFMENEKSDTDEGENLLANSMKSHSEVEGKSSIENEESDVQSKDDIDLTWENLLVDNVRYKQVLMLIGENFRVGEVNDTLKSNLSSVEIALVDKLFSYCDSHNDLPEELKETFTTFCKADEYKDMFFEDDNEFYNAVSKGFEISWKSDGTYYIGLYIIPKTDYSADKNFLDAERYVDNGCILYTFANGQYEKYATVEDVIYGEIIDDVCYGFGIKLDFVDTELNVDEYKDGDGFFNNVRSEDGTPKYYVSVYDLNRKAKANPIDYGACWNWKPLGDVTYKKGLNVYMGVGSCKRYQFTILDSKATDDYMLVRYPDGNEEVKSYYAMIGNPVLYVMDD